MRAFSGWTTNPLANVLVRVMQRGITQSRGSIKWPGRQRWEGCGPKSRNVRSHQKLGKAKNRFAPRSSREGMQPCQYLDFRFLTFKMGRGSISVLSYQFVVMHYSSHRRLILSTLTLLLSHPLPYCLSNVLSALLSPSSWSNCSSWDAVPPHVCTLSSFISFRPLFKLYANVT